jgi:AraC-like DNA-binding protein
MIFDFNFYSSLLLVTFSQGILYTFLLLKKGISTGIKSNYWLSLFVLICSLYVAPWMLGFAGWYDNQPYRNFMFYTPFQHLFFVGPLMFFYIQSLLNPAFRVNKKQFLHLIPGILYIIYNIFMIVYDKFIIKQIYFYSDGMDKDFDGWYHTIGEISMVCYFIISLIYYNRYRKLIVQISSNADSILFRWIKTYLIAFLVMILLPFVFDFLKQFINEDNAYKNDWWFFLSYSIVLYYIAITGYANAIETKIGFELSLFNQKSVFLLEQKSNDVIEKNTIDIVHEEIAISENPDLLLWKQKIEDLVVNDKLFENPELSLSDISRKLKTNATVISRTINQGFELNFNDFVNNYRIEAVKNALKNGEHKKTTLLGIAYDCGFNSKATFNRAFKKNTGLSPKEFLLNL